MTITKPRQHHSSVRSNADIATTIARLVKENSMYRETLRQIADSTAFASDEVTTIGWINKAARNALSSVNQTNGVLK